MLRTILQELVGNVRAHFISCLTSRKWAGRISMDRPNTNGQMSLFMTPVSHTHLIDMSPDHHTMALMAVPALYYTIVVVGRIASEIIFKIFNFFY